MWFIIAEARAIAALHYTVHKSSISHQLMWFVLPGQLGPLLSMFTGVRLNWTQYRLFTRWPQCGRCQLRPAPWSYGHTGCPKKTHLKEMCDFLTLKMLPLALALIKTKNRHLFDPMVRNPSFSRGNCSLSFKTLISHVKMSIFWPMGQKDGDFFV